MRSAAEFKTQVLWPTPADCSSQFVLHDRAVFTVNHEDSLLDLDAFDFVREDRKWIETELLQVSKALGMNHARIAVCREVKRLPIDEQRFFQLGEQDEPAPHRRLGGSHQQAVVAAGIQPDNRRRSKAAETVGFQPLPTESSVQVTARFSS